MEHQSVEQSGDRRFAFGKNWQKFAERVTDEHIKIATEALAKALNAPSLEGLTFLDVGGGSGLHSLAARSLGARVHGFDYDDNSVACMRMMRERYRPGDPDWTIEQGSALDAGYLMGLGQFDIVYSWGVLHHTGNMWRALDLVEQRVKPGGLLFLALYNDQGLPSKVWRGIKKAYVDSPPLAQAALVEAVRSYFVTRTSVGGILRRKNVWRAAKAIRSRGMEGNIDLVDWVGGYPFEVSTPDEIFSFYHARGYSLEHLKTCGSGLGCNEFVFRSRREDSAP